VQEDLAKSKSEAGMEISALNDSLPIPSCSVAYFVVVVVLVVSDVGLFSVLGIF
jgi:hypothetical protein